MSDNTNRKLSMEELGRMSIDEFKHTSKHPITIVLDNIRSLHNVGSAFRTSDAFLAEKIYLCGITGKPPHRDIHKTALGATDSVEWEHVPDTAALLTKLKGEGYTILIAEQTEASIPLQSFDFQPDAKYAVVFGNEVFGVSDDALPLADHCLEIPQFGTKHSLNISVSLGVILWQYISKRI